jgi:threonine aldolase
MPKNHFTSDNTAGICPEAWSALEKANSGRLPSYGNDDWTDRAAGLIRELFEFDCEVFFVFNGTAANSLALASLCQSYHSVLCHELAHVETDECGAPEFFSNGAKILLLRGDEARIAPSEIEHAVKRRSDIHFPKPRVVSLTQATELGTVYQPDEIRHICEVAHGLNLSVHMDGARFANAVASLALPPKTFTWEAGVDVLCFGGSKNGMAIGEAVVFFRKELAEEFDYRCKQAGQLCSKMRFLASQWVGMLEDGAWLRHARHANRMATRLADAVRPLPGISIKSKVEANGIFLHMSDAIAEGLLSRGWIFHNFIGNSGYRFMCSWATTPEEIDELVSDMKDTVTTEPNDAGTDH